jgi:hypothetical protein
MLRELTYASFVLCHNRAREKRHHTQNQQDAPQHGDTSSTIIWIHKHIRENLLSPDHSVSEAAFDEYAATSGKLNCANPLSAHAKNQICRHSKPSGPEEPERRATLKPTQPGPPF